MQSDVKLWGCVFGTQPDNHSVSLITQQKQFPWQKKKKKSLLTIIKLIGSNEIGNDLLVLKCHMFD